MSSTSSSIGNTALLLSVRPKHALAIASGRKRIELRRRKPAAPNQSIVIIYACSPLRKIIACGVLARVESGPPDRMWPEVRSRACVSESEYSDYFKNATLAHALFLSGMVRLEHPITLSAIRKRARNFSPPRSFKYVPWNFLAKIQARQSTIL